MHFRLKIERQKKILEFQYEQRQEFTMCVIKEGVKFLMNLFSAPFSSEAQFSVLNDFQLVQNKTTRSTDPVLYTFD